MKRIFLFNIILILVAMLTACNLIDEPNNYTNNAYTSTSNASSSKSKTVASPSSVVEIAIKNDNAENETFSYEIEYPIISNLQNASKQTEINSKIKKQVYDFMAKIKSLSEAQSKSEYFMPYSVTTDFETKTLSPQIISMLGSFSQDTGGAHPNYSIVPYNIDAISGKFLSLEDIFVPDFDYKTIINKEIKNQIKKDTSGNIYFQEKNLRFASISPMQQFYIENGQLFIQFDTYEIAPYSTGAPSFFIRNDTLIEGVKNQYKSIFINQ